MWSVIPSLRPSISRLLMRNITSAIRERMKITYKRVTYPTHVVSPDLVKQHPTIKIVALARCFHRLSDNAPFMRLPAVTSPPRKPFFLCGADRKTRWAYRREREIKKRNQSFARREEAKEDKKERRKGNVECAPAENKIYLVLRKVDVSRGGERVVES